MELRSIPASQLQSISRALRGRPVPASQAEPVAGEGNEAKPGRPVMARIHEARERLASRLENAVQDASTPHQRRILEERARARGETMEARIRNFMADRAAGAAAGGDAVAPTADAPSAAPGAALSQSDRRAALAARLSASQGAGSLGALPDDLLTRLAALLGGGGLSFDPASPTTREGGFIENFEGAVAALEDRARSAIDGAENANQRRIIGDRMADALSEMSARLRDAIRGIRSDAQGTPVADAETQGGRTGRVLRETIDAARAQFFERVTDSLAGAENTNQLRILRERAAAGHDAMEHRIHGAMVAAGMIHDDPALDAPQREHGPGKPTGLRLDLAPKLDAAGHSLLAEAKLGLRRTG